MSLDPSLEATVARLDEEAAAAAAPATDWDAYGKCSQVCRQPTGKPCISQSGRIVGGRPDGALTPLAVPHAARKLLKRRKTAFTSAPLAR